MSSQSIRWSSVIAAAAVVLLWAAAAGAVPTSLTHQGRLLGDDGKPMSGQVSLKFTIYDAETGGSIVWESMPKQVDLGDAGFYSVQLGGSQNPIDSAQLAGKSLWVALQVDGGEELAPRIRIRSVPYAIRSGTAESVADGAVDSDALADGAVESNHVSGVDWGKVQNKPATIGDLQCSADQVAAWDGTNWVCRSESKASYSAGGGLDLNNETFSLSQQSCGAGQVAAGIDTSGSLICRPDAETTYDKNCPSGQVVGALAADGSVTCVPDSDTTYSAGAGLTKSNNTFSIADQACGTGEAATGFSGGSLQCTTVGDITAVSAGTGLSGGGQSGSVSVSANFTEVQRRVSGSCANGQLIESVNQDGTVNCNQAGESASTTTTSGSCGTFRPAQVCPVGGEDGPGCGSVPVGSYCEADGCGLDGGINNCGIFDWFFKTAN